jgi:competence CoiA-like predicted nuclease
MPDTIDDCVKKLRIRIGNGQEWMFLEDQTKPCDCKYMGESKVFYCRSKKVYFELKKDKRQLELPFE